MSPSLETPPTTD